MAKMLPLLDSVKSSKEDEKNFLKIVVEQAGIGTYMGSFFTCGLIDWLVQKINDDYSTDLWHDYQYEVHQREDIISSQADHIRNYQDRLTDLQKKLDACEEASMERAQMRDKFACECTKWQEEYNEMRTRLVSERDDEQTKVKELEAQVIDLKCMIFDLRYLDNK